MTALYDDAGPPVRVCGYASVFGVDYETERGWQRIAAGAFDLARYPIFAALDHDHGQQLGRIGHGLRLWQDRHGLAFELNLPATQMGLAVARGVRRGLYRAASFSSPPDGVRTVRVVREHGRAVNVIDGLRVDEVSLVTAGANPEAVTWLDHEQDDDLPAHVREARARWLAGRSPVQRRPSARITASARRKARPSQHLLDQIDRLIAGRVSNAAAISSVPAGLGRDHAHPPEIVGQPAGRGASSGRKGWEAGNIPRRRL